MENTAQPSHGASESNAETMRVRHHSWLFSAPRDLPKDSKARRLDWPIALIQKSERISSDNCYCDLWQTDPDFLADAGVTRGYCGVCFLYGAPGHVRHHPGRVPCSGAWCDHHYSLMAKTHHLIGAYFIDQKVPLSKVGCLCDFWESRPEAMESFGFEQGFCAYCEDCGKPGHIQPHPLTAFTAKETGWWAYPRGWCDDHYMELIRICGIDVDALLKGTTKKPWWRIW